MIPTITIWRRLDPSSGHVLTFSFWGSFALASIIASLFAYPINYWLVKTGQKHGMMSAKPKGASEEGMQMGSHSGHQAPKVSKLKLFSMTILTLILLAIGVIFGFLI